MLPDHMATFLGQKSADDKNLGFAKPFHLAYFDDFNVDIPSSNNIHSRFHISDGYKYPIFEILCTKLWRKQELRLIYTGRKIHIGIDKIIEKNDPVVNSSICSLTSVSDTARCFSCMSRLYEAVWPALSSIYKRPKNFTDLCNDNDLDPQYVPFTYCPTICIRMWEEPTVADEQLVGVRIRGHIRGCLDELLYNGFNQTIVTWYRWMHRDSCRQYRKRELFKLPTELSDDSYITVCTCYADYCNGRSSAGTTGRGASHCPFFLVLLCSFIILFFIQRISWSVRIFVYHISYL
ncbi:unnamed protein product [Onchocerca ochengi]|uniref:Protein quiver n=1 Tax=Onchocerca ochengi TaxID=42157 RepID=A0A182E7P1_ONCOC|nr:unnamed protein product [Onchocerca ochengi]